MRRFVVEMECLRGYALPHCSLLSCLLPDLQKRSLNITLSAPDDSPAEAWSFDSPACDCSTALSQFCQQLEACRSIAASSAALEKEWAEGLRPESEDLRYKESLRDLASPFLLQIQNYLLGVT